MGDQADYQQDWTIFGHAFVWYVPPSSPPHLSHLISPLPPPSLFILIAGELSEMFVDLYNAISELRGILFMFLYFILNPNIIHVLTHSFPAGLVLAPCCLSKRKRIFADTAAKLKINNYDYWTMHLYWMIQQSKKDICADSNVFSVKNNYISAVKCG